MVAKPLSILSKTTSLILMLLLVGCNSATTPSNTPLQNATVQLSWFHQSQFAGFYAAIDQGYYKAEGVNITVNGGGISDKGYIDPMELVSSGKADFGLASTNEIMKARANGKLLVAIASTLQRSPRAFISLATKNIQRPQDLIGKRVAYRADDNSVYLALLKSQNIDRSGIKEITDASKFSLDALIKDEIDVIPAFLDNEPVVLETRGYKTNAILVFDYGIETYENLIFTRQELIDKNPDLVQRVLRATLKGYQYAINNPDQASALALKYDSKLDANAQKASMLKLLPLINIPNSHVGAMNAAVWTNAYQVLIDQGILSKPQDVNAAYNLSFLKAIYPDMK